MTITAAQLVAEVGATGVDKAKSDISGFGGFLDGIGGKITGGLGTAFSVASNLAGDALHFLGSQLVDSVKLAMDHQQVMAQTAQAIKSTGDASGMTAQSIGDLANSLSRVTPFSEDTVQSGENLLLTFTGIGKKVFPDATQAMLDMAQAMHQGPEQGAIMLGKALNDPTTGLTALTRVGVTFSAQEKEQIKVMMAHNDVAGAQKVMLKELETEFGGSAKAAGQTFAGQLQIATNTLNDLKVKIGTALLPILQYLAGFLDNKVLPALGSLIDNVGKGFTYIGNVLKTVNMRPFEETWNSLKGAVGEVTAQFSKFFSALSPLKGVGTDFDPLANTIQGLAKGALGIVTDLMQKLAHVLASINVKQVASDIGGLFTAFNKFSVAGNLIDALSRHAQELGKWFQTSVVPAMKQAEPGFAQLGKAIVGLIPAFEKIADIVHNSFQKAFDALLPVFEKAIPIIIRIAGILADGLGKAIQFLTPYIVQAVAAIGTFADEIAQRVAPIVMQFFDGLNAGLNFLEANWKYIWPVLSGLLKGIWDEIVGVIKIAWAIVSGIIKIGLDLLSGNWSQAWNDLKDMLGGVWDGIKQFISGGLEIVNNLFLGLPAKALKWGEDMIQGFINGIQNMLGNLGNTVSNIASTIAKYLHFSKPDVGPLADFDTYAPDMVNLFTKGIHDNLGKVKDAVGTLSMTVSTGMSPQSTLSGAAIVPQSMMQGTSAQQITVKAPDIYLDGRLLTRAQMPYLVDAIRLSSTGINGR